MADGNFIIIIHNQSETAWELGMGRRKRVVLSMVMVTELFLFPPLGRPPTWVHFFTSLL
jgi:hypothetical protein